MTSGNNRLADLGGIIAVHVPLMASLSTKKERIQASKLLSYALSHN
jgi:hypothetical protein